MPNANESKSDNKEVSAHESEYEIFYVQIPIPGSMITRSLGSATLDDIRSFNHPYIITPTGYFSTHLFRITTHRSNVSIAPTPHANYTDASLLPVRGNIVVQGPYE